MKIAVITGASSGIGKEFARQIPKLYNNLDELWLIARSTEKLKQLEKELTLPVRIFDGDLKRDYIYERIQKALSSHQADIRMLVNSAGFGKTGRFNESSLDGQLGMIDVNCRALTKVLYICLPYLSKGSRVVNIASAAAFAPQPGFSVYAATKSYVYRFSQAVRQELKESGISVTTVCPGPVDTSFFECSGELPGKSRNIKKAGPRSVVRRALIDAADKKSVSVYGTSMKTARMAAKFLPSTMVASVMKRVNQI